MTFATRKRARKSQQLRQAAADICDQAELDRVLLAVEDRRMREAIFELIRPHLRFPGVMPESETAEFLASLCPDLS